jgi:molybdopterin-binding protein
MNILRGSITKITTAGELSLVDISLDKYMLSAIVLDIPSTSNYLREGNPVKVFFKETEVIIARSPLAISTQNKLTCRIRQILKGRLLCELSLDLEEGPGTIQSIITLNACEQMNLQENERVIALIQTNEVCLSADD